jgi:hypothetical protein
VLATIWRACLGLSILHELSLAIRNRKPQYPAPALGSVFSNNASAPREKVAPRLP